MPKYTKSVEMCKMKHRYPCNLFLELFPDFNDDKFATVYVDNITIILNVFKHENLGFKILKMSYEEHLTFERICGILNIMSSDAVRLANEAKDIIKRNKEVIFNGFAHSKLRNKTIGKLTREGFNKNTATALVDSGLYCVRDIKNLKDGKELIKVLSKNMDSERVGKVLEDTLITMNKLGFDTTRFGYSGKKPSNTPKSNNTISTAVKPGTLNKITDYAYDGFSTTTFKIQCPKCNRFFRIHIVGKVDKDGKLCIEHTAANESGIFLCQNCMSPVSIDKVDKFIRNYL